MNGAACLWVSDEDFAGANCGINQVDMKCTFITLIGWLAIVIDVETPLMLLAPCSVSPGAISSRGPVRLECGRLSGRLN